MGETLEELVESLGQGESQVQVLLDSLKNDL